MEKKKIRHKIDSTDVFNLHEYDISIPSREIFLNSYCCDEGAEVAEDGINEPGIDYRNASRFIKNISLLNTQGSESILIHQNMAGGDWNYGMAIYDSVISSVAPVTILAYAHARSMSSIILQAADKRVLMPDCYFLIHHGWWGMYDRVTPAISNIEYWKKHETPRMLDIYANRCKKGRFFKGKTKKQIVEFILKKLEQKTDWILTAKEAVHYGFADGILGKKGFETIEKIKKI